MSEWFDELSKGLAAGQSRRGVLRLLGLGTAAGGLASLLPGRALANGGGNSACAHYCHEVFSGAAAGQCTSQAAHGGGPCYTCGPAAPTGHPDLCGQVCCPSATPNCCSGTCVSLAGDVHNCGTCGKVCPAGPANSTTTCVNSQCGFVCNSGYKLCGSACIPAASCCTVADCPAGPANSTTTCVNGQCGFVCNQGFTLVNGQCVLQACTPTIITGSLSSSDPKQNGRPFRGGIASSCATPNACSTLPGSFAFHAYTFVNTTTSTQCVSATLATSCIGTNFIYSVAYLGSFNPANICADQVGDAGISPNEIPTTFSFNVPAGATFTVVVSEVNSGGGCSNYTLTVSCGAQQTTAAVTSSVARAAVPNAAVTTLSPTKLSDRD